MRNFILLRKKCLKFRIKILSIVWCSCLFGCLHNFVLHLYSGAYLLTDLRYATECFWEASRISASQEMPRVLWNPKVHYRSQKCPPTLSIPSQLHPIHTPTSHFLKIYLNIILLTTPESSTWTLSCSFPHQNPIYTSPLPPYVLNASPTSFFSILLPEQYWVRSTEH